MGLIREPKNVDFFVIDSPWSEEDKRDFSELIKQEKQRYRARLISPKTKIQKHFA